MVPECGVTHGGVELSGASAPRIPTRMMRLLPSGEGAE